MSIRTSSFLFQNASLENIEENVTPILPDCICVRWLRLGFVRLEWCSETMRPQLKQGQVERVVRPRTLQVSCLPFDSPRASGGSSESQRSGSSGVSLLKVLVEGP